MAKIVQKPMKLSGKEFRAGDVIPKDIEQNNSWISHLQSGRVIALPDELVESAGIDLSENNGLDIDLNKTIDELEEDVKQINSGEILDDLFAKEARGQDRKGVYQLLQQRKQDL